MKVPKLSDPLLPHFIIIGAMKSGTTTLYRYLDAHPDISMSRDKEPDFFIAEKNWSRGLDWYAHQFTAGAFLRGEASPNYTKGRDFTGVPARMAAICPNAKLVYIVRDPVERAVSQFRHSFLFGDIDPDIHNFFEDPEYAHILDASLYARQLDIYLAHFTMDAILVLDFDKLVADPQRVLDRITNHIGAPQYSITQAGARNDSAQLSRVPKPVLRFSQSAIGQKIAGWFRREMRDWIRNRLSFGKQRCAPPFPDALKARLREDIGPDAARFREMTGLCFKGWSV